MSDLARLIQTNANESAWWAAANGITKDGGFAHHTGCAIQNLTLTYGKDWYNTTRNAANDLTGTPWDLGAAELDPLAVLFLDGLQWMMHAGHGDLTAVGRNTGLQNEWHNQNSSVVGFINGLLNTAEAGELTRRTELIAMRDRLNVGGEIDGNKAFWDLGLQVQARDDYYVSVKIGSERTTGPESGVGNGLQNFHMNDGFTQIIQHGNEYNNAKVAWNWHALPGITAEQRTDALPLVNWGGNGQRGDNVFGGSVSNGTNGLSAFYYNKENTYATVNANKGYFFFDKEFVALGSGVQRESSGQSKEIWTTLNQAERFSNVIYNVGGSNQSIGLGTNLQQDFNNLSSPVWFHQDGVGYVIVPKSGSQVNVKLWVENRTGNWSDIGIQTGTQTVNMFQLAINHATNPNNNNTNHYQYVVVPNITAAEMGNYVSNLMPTILSNTTSRQAVQHAALGLTEITFYQAGSFQVPGGPLVSVDHRPRANPKISAATACALATGCPPISGVGSHPMYSLSIEPSEQENDYDLSLLKY